MESIISNGWNSYWIVRNALKDPSDEFLKTFGFSDELIDLANDMLLADSWDSLPDHSNHIPDACDVCSELAR